MKKIILYGSFEQHDYKLGKGDFVKLWDKLNYDLYQTNENYCFELPLSILTITSLQNSINLIFGLRKIYCKNFPRIKLHFTNNYLESYYNIQLLPESFTEMLDYTWSFMLTKINTECSSFIGFDPLELDQLENITEYMRQGILLPKEYVQEQHRLFYQNILKYDTDNNLNFCEIFPNLANFYKDCEKV